MLWYLLCKIVCDDCLSIEYVTEQTLICRDYSQGGGFFNIVYRGTSVTVLTKFCIYIAPHRIWCLVISFRCDLRLRLMKRYNLEKRPLNEVLFLLKIHNNCESFSHILMLEVRCKGTLHSYFYGNLKTSWKDQETLMFWNVEPG